MVVQHSKCVISSIANNNLSSVRLKPPRKEHKSLLVHSTWDARDEEESSLGDVECLENCSMLFQTLRKLMLNRAFQSTFDTHTSPRPLCDLESRYCAYFTGEK